MNRNIKVGVVQMNSHVGAIDYNLKKIIKFIKLGRNRKVDLLCFPELALVGYPPEDLLLSKNFLKATELAVKQIQRIDKNISYIVGYPKLIGGKLYNVAGVFIHGELKYEYKKIRLPNYGVFDEQRYFETGEEPLIFKFKNRNICLTICEDIWNDFKISQGSSKEYLPDLLINLSASPFNIRKQNERLKLLGNIARKNNIEVVYSNLVGGQDEVVFDGNSFFLDCEGRMISKAQEFQEELKIQDLNYKKENKKPFFKRKNKQDNLSSIFSALSIGLRDYVIKNGFKKVVIGISGGIDSALVSAIAVKSLGPKNVLGIAMPSKFNSELSLKLAQMLSANLGFRLKVSSIQEIFQKNLELLSKKIYGKTSFDATEENLQARIRANILMATSNKIGSLLLSTGNKSEISVGYSTLYGDAAGGIAILKDIPKILVYDLARFYNSQNSSNLIPNKIISRDPSAELRANQKDSDSLPPYRILDKILEAYIEGGKEVSEISRLLKVQKSLVRKIINKINDSEFKRKQGPPGIKITSKAFGRDRRYPITNGFKEA
ncbi:NAD+ synthase [bacterium]|jgi:NAD+ synthase (glutamine-hydrolysing)|nr:NAD+ synthase [bacterium]MBT3795811.1 NAD+ synthase [bacterium]MBT4634311.1 NAD+ synthase [bacterium]